MVEKDDHGHQHQLLHPMPFQELDQLLTPVEPDKDHTTLPSMLKTLLMDTKHTQTMSGVKQKIAKKVTSHIIILHQIRLLELKKFINTDWLQKLSLK